MKRNINLLILAGEIGMIIILHALKISQGSQKTAELNSTVAKANKVITPVGKHNQLLSLK